MLKQFFVPEVVIDGPDTFQTEFLGGKVLHGVTPLGSRQVLPATYVLAMDM